MSKFIANDKVYSSISECKVSMPDYNVRGRIPILEVKDVSYEPVRLLEVWANLKHKWTTIKEW